MADTATEGSFELDQLPDDGGHAERQQLRLVVNGDDVTIGGAQVQPPAIEASNGIIHVISSLPTA